MLVKLEESAYPPFSTRNPATGEASNADSLPTSTIYEDGVLLGYGGTVVDLAAAGQYHVAVAATAANGFEVGKQYNVRVSATVGGVTDTTQIGTFQVAAGNHGKVIGDGVPEAAAGGDGGLLLLGTTNTAGIHIAVPGGIAVQFESPNDIGLSIEGIRGVDINGTIVSGMRIGVDDPAQTALELVGGDSGGVGLRASGSVGAVGLFEEEFFGVPISTYMIMAGIGAGAGKMAAVDQDAAPVTFDATDNRVETYDAPDDSPFFSVEVDKNGIRNTVTIL